ncbi:stage III sporulation protein AE precursor [Clostridium tepidiprofundi DSM 19306]|uniref:Stage III sporulation protein AE n=1 Tax=Clostridium tepidiprofundi DSM 19306 TaxID=1121338 RepID=A0A151B718_9CLOT|nr:stage III sporulation protein AE [Clostridium tepidiprofundi]KYH35689.1 stage III sporulation protein AE precursor [Clostridium tepidiprofundi DSM 19306]
MENKRLIFIVLMVISLITMPIVAKASGISNMPNNLTERQSNEINKLYEYISNMKTDYEILNDFDAKTYIENFIQTGESGVTFSKVIKYLSKYLFIEIGSTIKFIGILIIISIICVLLNNLQNILSDGEITNIAYFACYSMIIIILAKSFYIGIDLAKSTIITLTNFMAALMPVLMMLLASVGGFTQAASMDPIIIGVTSIGARIFVDFVIPLAIMSFVTVFVNNISSDYKISRLSKLLNQVVLWTQGIIMTIFVGVISVRGIVSQTIDQVTLKTAKFAVDSFVPIIGKSISDAIATVAGYSLLLKSALGVLGLFLIIIIVLLPILKLLIMAILYKLTAALLEPISDSKIIKCIDSAGDSLILIMSCVISISIMSFIMIAIVASTGRAIMYG